MKHLFKSIYRGSKKIVDSVLLIIGFFAILMIATFLLPWIGTIHPIVFGSLIIGASIIIAAKILQQ